MNIALVRHHIKLKQIGHIRQAYCKDENLSHTHSERERERARELHCIVGGLSQEGRGKELAVCSRFD